MEVATTTTSISANNINSNPLCENLPLNHAEDNLSNSTVFMEADDDKEHSSEELEDKSEAITSNKKKYHNIPNDIRQKLIDAVENKGEKIKHAAKRLMINYSSAKSICQVFKREGRSKKKSIKQRLPKQEAESNDNTTATQEALNNLPAQDQNFTINHLLRKNSDEQSNTSDTLTKLKNRLLEGRNSSVDRLEYHPYKKVQIQQSEDTQSSPNQDYMSSKDDQLQHLDRVLAQNNNILNGNQFQSNSNQQVYTQGQNVTQATNTSNNVNMIPSAQTYTMMPQNNYGIPVQVPQQRAYMVNGPTPAANRPQQMQPVYFAGPNGPMPYMMPAQSPVVYQPGYPAPFPGAFPTQQPQNGEMMYVMNGQNTPMYYGGYQQPPMYYPQPQVQAQPQYIMSGQPQQMGGFIMQQPQQQQQQQFIMVPNSNYLRGQNIPTMQPTYVYPENNFAQQVQNVNVQSNPTMVMSEAPQNSSDNTTQQSDVKSSNTSSASSSDSSSSGNEGTIKKIQVQQGVNSSSKPTELVVTKKELDEAPYTTKKVVFDNSKSRIDILSELKAKEHKGFIRHIGLKGLAQDDKVEAS